MTNFKILFATTNSNKFFQILSEHRRPHQVRRSHHWRAGEAVYLTASQKMTSAKMRLPKMTRTENLKKSHGCRNRRMLKRKKKKIQLSLLWNWEDRKERAREKCRKCPPSKFCVMWPNVNVNSLLNRACKFSWLIRACKFLTDFCFSAIACKFIFLLTM